MCGCANFDGYREREAACNAGILCDRLERLMFFSFRFMMIINLITYRQIVIITQFVLKNSFANK